MKKTDSLILVLAGGLAVGLRVGQMLTGFDDAGLPIAGQLCGLLLPVVLVLAAAYFVFSARKLPKKRGECGGLADCFRFSGNMTATVGAVAGAFLVMAGGAAGLMGRGSAGFALLSVFAVAAALSVLYVVFALYRGKSAQGIALLVPVCCLVVYLIFIYRTDASNPLLARIYVEILAIAALTYAALERAAFAFGNGSPRVYLPVNAMAAVLAACAAAEGRSMASVLLFAGCALAELGFLSAADFEKQ